MVEERALPDAVARLVIFNVDEVHLPSPALEAEALDVLCQHGLDRLMASPMGWSHVVDHRTA
jgi:hypothetical protein